MESGERVAEVKYRLRRELNECVKTTRAVERKCAFEARYVVFKVHHHSGLVV